MATNRFQFSDDFVLKNGKVGINTAEPQEKLEVLGTIIADNIRASDISNLHTYEGFLNQNQNIDENLTLSSDTTTSLSGEIIVGDDATVTIGSEATSSQGNIDSLKVYNTFTVPTGGTEERPRKVKPGQLFFNKDFATMEFWDGNVWRQVDNTTQSGRGVFGGGKEVPAAVTTIDYINISSQGNALNFGNLTVARKQVSAFSSSTRGLWAGGYNPTLQNVIDYVTLASEGNAIDFGDLNASVGTRSTSSVSSSTRGLICGGYTQPAAIYTNTIEYVEISTTGNAQDFGDLVKGGQSFNGGVSNSTRGIIAGSYGIPAAINYPNIEYMTIASKGNAVDFGSSTQGRSPSGCSNSIRGIFSGGYNGPSPGAQNTVDYITIATTGNAQDFGDLTQARYAIASVSSSIRGVIGGGYVTGDLNTLDFVLISTAGNAQDFGDLTNGRGYALGGCSDSHGGLGGF